MSTFGDIERTFADLYEYRWAIGAGVLVLLVAVAAFGYWKGWHLAIWRRRLLWGVIGTPVLAVTIWLGWSLGSPLFTNVTVLEEFPFAVNATVPTGMERADIEGVLAGMAKVDNPVIEAMPGGADIAAAVAITGGEGSSKVIVMTEANKTTLLEGMDMVSGAKANLDVAMMDKGLGMMKAAVDNAGGIQPEVRRIKAGEFKDADSFHRGSGQADDLQWSG